MTDAGRALKAENAKVIAGGQSLGPMLNLRLARPAALVGVTGIGGMQDIRAEGDKIFIGAGVTHARVEDGDSPVDLPPMMRHVARAIAYRAVRNKGTIGGSLAHADPAADWITTMTALDADLVIAKGRKTRRVGMVDFMHGAYRTALQPAEIIAGVEISKAMSRRPLGL